MASPVRRGSTYEGDGRPPHLSKRSFLLEFRVARDGRRLTVLNVWNLAAACGTVSHYYPSFGFGPVQIRRDGTFRAESRDYTSDGRGIPVTVTGRFLSHGRARGTLRHRGRAARKGCNADGAWTAHVKGRPPRVQRFTGTTDKGTRVTFQRTIERHPHVTRFNFGSLRTSCGYTETVMTGVNGWPPYDEFALPVDQGRFSGEYTSSMGDYGGRINGRFDAKDRASGTVSYRDRADCTIDTIHWTAHRTTSK